MTDSKLYIRTLHTIHLNAPQKVKFALEFWKRWLNAWLQVIIASASTDTSESELYKRIYHRFPQVIIVTLPRNYFQEHLGTLCLTYAYQYLEVFYYRGTVYLRLWFAGRCLFAAAWINYEVINGNF